MEYKALFLFKKRKENATKFAVKSRCRCWVRHTVYVTYHFKCADSNIVYCKGRFVSDVVYNVIIIDNKAYCARLR